MYAIPAIGVQRGFKWRPIGVNGGQGSGGEDAFNGGALAPGAHEIGADLAAEEGAYRVDND